MQILKTSSSPCLYVCKALFLVEIARIFGPLAQGGVPEQVLYVARKDVRKHLHIIKVDSLTQKTSWLMLYQLSTREHRCKWVLAQARLDAPKGDSPLVVKMFCNSLTRGCRYLNKRLVWRTAHFVLYKTSKTYVDDGSQSQRNPCDIGSRVLRIQRRRHYLCIACAASKLSCPVAFYERTLYCIHTLLCVASHICSVATSQGHLSRMATPFACMRRDSTMCVRIVWLTAATTAWLRVSIDAGANKYIIGSGSHWVSWDGWLPSQWLAWNSWPE